MFNLNPKAYTQGPCLASFFIRLLDGASYAGTRVPNLGKPLPARFEKPEPVHRFTGKIF